MSDGDGLYFGPCAPDAEWTDKQLEQFAAEWRRKATGRPRLLTPLPRRVRARLAVRSAIDTAAIWLIGHGRLRGRRAAVARVQEVAEVSDEDPVRSLMSGFAHSREHVNGNKEWFAAQVRGTAPEPPADGFLVPPELAEIFSGWWGDLEAAARNQPKPPPPSWRTRLRRKLGDWRERTARRAYRIVAGYWPDNGEDDWLWMSSSPSRAPS